MADWLESYATTLELNIWTSCTVVGATQDADNKWRVRVHRDDGSERVFRVNHLGGTYKLCYQSWKLTNALVIATGLGDGIPTMPDIPNSVSGTFLG